MLQGNSDLRSIVMINCGAICDVVDLLSYLSPEAYVYIIDSNRPVHLANVYPKKDRCQPFSRRRCVKNNLTLLATLTSTIVYVKTLVKYIFTTHVHHQYIPIEGLGRERRIKLDPWR